MNVNFIFAPSCKSSESLLDTLFGAFQGFGPCTFQVRCARPPLHEQLVHFRYKLLHINAKFSAKLVCPPPYTHTHTHARLTCILNCGKLFMKRFCFSVLLQLLLISILRTANAISVARLPAQEMAGELIMVFLLMPN